MIFGFYGYENTGDELILQGMIECLRTRLPKAEITVLSANPEQTAARYKVRSVYAGRRFQGLSVVWKALAKTDLFILGGGGLLQDRERRILPFWFSRVWMASVLGVRIMFYGLGAGPVTTNLGKRQLQYFGNRADLITVRDEMSYQTLIEAGVRKTPIHITADPALSLREDGRANKDGRDQAVMVVCPRYWPGWERKRGALASALASWLDQTKGQVVFLPLQGEEDQKAGRQIQSRMNHMKGEVVVASPNPPRQVLMQLKKADMVISMRLHGLIGASLYRVPWVGIAYDPKVSEYAQRVDMGDQVTALDDIDRDKLDSLLLASWEKREELARKLEQKVPGLAQKADENADYACALLKR